MPLAVFVSLGGGEVVGGVSFYLKSSRKKIIVRVAVVRILMKSLPWYCGSVSLLVMSAVSVKPIWSQPKQAVPTRSFPPGVQLDSPVPINRGNDVLGLEGFLEPDKRSGSRNLPDSTSSTQQKGSRESAIESDSMFGYETELDDGKLNTDSESVLQSEKFLVPENVGTEADVSDVFGSGAKDKCSKEDASSFCSAFE